MRSGGITRNQPRWKTISNIREALERKWRKGIILREALDPAGFFPVRLFLSGPEPSDLSARFIEARDWVKEYAEAEMSGRLRIEWKEVNNRVLGQNRIPVAVIFETPEQIAEFLNATKEYALFMQVSGELLSAFPGLKAWLLKNAGCAAALTPSLQRLMAVTQWIMNNPEPQIFLRQLCVRGVDTKFIETNKKVIGDWLDIVLPPRHINSLHTGSKGFEQRFGFLTKPALVRFRLLDKTKAPAGFSDITVRADEFCRIEQEVRIVFVIENDINCLSFPPVKDSMVIFGRGYGFDFLAGASWLRSAKIWYWGDIDTHGLAILSGFREYFPDSRSFLMDRNVLLECKDSWSTEPEQCAAMPSHLDEKETQLFLDLKEDRLGKSVRLEQELIPFDMVKAAVVAIEAEL